jgi:signal transduction histidine kinase
VDITLTQYNSVDDILTLSKLDSNLLVISPNQVRPHDLVQNAMKMFEAELSSSQIEASITVDESYKTLSIENVLLDESRVLQILLNLITNAIKFTRNRRERYVRIRLPASQSRPSIVSSDISYIAPRVSRPVNQGSTESGIDENVYLIFAVEDTGPGLGKDDMKSLFQRFS